MSHDCLYKWKLFLDCKWQNQINSFDAIVLIRFQKDLWFVDWIFQKRPLCCEWTWLNLGGDTSHAHRKLMKRKDWRSWGRDVPIGGGRMEKLGWGVSFQPYFSRGEGWFNPLIVGHVTTSVLNRVRWGLKVLWYVQLWAWAYHLPIYWK